MRWLIVAVALLGVLTATAALREHYNTGVSPCSINDKWDCGIVNHSPYAVFGGVPVALIGICGYSLLGGLAWKKAWLALFPTAAAGLVFSLYLTRIEANILQVWCLYCVISQTVIFLITVLALVALLLGRKKRAQFSNDEDSVA
jgi:vitamin-K-epoxide reductase (warfarin-sensitive)